MDSLAYLQEKLTHLQQKYPHRPRYCALRMFLASAHAMYMRMAPKPKTHDVQSPEIKTPQASPCRIAFDVKGGLGDLIIAANYIHCFLQYANNPQIQVIINYHTPQLIKSICDNLPIVQETQIPFSKQQADLRIELNRFPKILEGDIDAVTQKSPRLAQLLSAWKNFFTHNRKFFDWMPQADGLGNLYCELLGMKRINQADIGKVLNIPEKYLYSLPYKDEESVLQKFNLQPKRYITIQRGQSLTEKSSSNTKLWPVGHYNALVRLLKAKKTGFQIIQLGMERKGFGQVFESVDMNLVGQTSLEDLKVI